MRSAALPLVALLFSSAASAQLTLLPQIGLDNSRTTLSYNGGKAFAPLGRQFSPRASVRLDYRLKGGHGPFVGVATSPAPVDYRFSVPASGDRIYRAGNADQPLRLEGGWQYSSKPIVLKSRKAAAPAPHTTIGRTEVRSRCGGSYYTYRGHCSREKVTPPKDNSWNLRVQPFAGAAYIPLLKEDLSAQSGNYTYKAGNWNTALLAGSGFEVGRGSSRLFTLSVQYLKALGHLNEKTLVTESDAKTSTTHLKSAVSAWSVGVGLPFSLTKKKTAPLPTRTQATEPRSRCSEYRARCSRREI